MTIIIHVTKEEIQEIMSEKTNCCDTEDDIKCCVIDSLDSQMLLPGYDIEIVIIDGVM